MMMTTSSIMIHKVYEVLVERDHSAMTKTTAKTHRTSKQNWRMMTCFIPMMNYYMLNLNMDWMRLHMQLNSLIQK